MRSFVANEKAVLRSTIVIAAILSASVSLLLDTYLWGFELSVDEIFRKLTPILVGICLLSLIGTVILLQRRWQWSGNIIAAIVIIFISHLIYYRLVQSFFDFTIDDTFITFRYSRNLADGFGPTFNPGQAPVEGYTTFLWMLIMSIPHFLRFDALLFSKLFGMALGELTLIFAMLISTQISAVKLPGQKLLAASVTCLFIAAFYPMAIHTISGMETVLFTALLAGTVYVALLSDTHRMAAIVTPVAMLLLGLTRPEGNLLNAGLLAALLFNRTSPYRRTLLYSTLLLYIVPGILYFAWRLSYYQLLFPLPYYSKLGNNHRPEGVTSVFSFILMIAPSIMFPLLFAFRKVTRQHIIVATPIVSLLLFYLFPQHIMGIYSRFVFPAAPLLHALSGAGVINLLVNFQSGSESKSTAMNSLFAIVCIALVALSPLANIATIRSQSQGAVRAINPYIYFGRLLRSFPAARPMTLAIGDAGAIPYYSQWNTIDLVGLNDPVTLFETSHQAYLEYVFSKDPDLILLTFNDAEDPVRDVALTNEIYEAALAHGMQKIGVLKVSETYYLWICAEPGTPLEEYIRRSLKGHA